jgi:hypothetical protein
MGSVYRWPHWRALVPSSSLRSDALWGLFPAARSEKKIAYLGCAPGPWLSPFSHCHLKFGARHRSRQGSRRMSSGPLLWLDGVWMLLLAFAYLVLHRDLAILDLRTRYGGSVPDGLEIGVPVPRISGLKQADVYVFLFGDCSSCHELVRQLGDSHKSHGLVIVVTDGSIPNSGYSLAGQFPPAVTTHTGPLADRIAESFKVHSGPLGICVSNGVVVAKGYLRHMDDVELLVHGRDPNGSPAVRGRELPQRADPLAEAAGGTKTRRAGSA